MVFLVLMFLLAMLLEEFPENDEVLRVLLSLILAMLVVPGMSKVL